MKSFKAYYTQVLKTLKKEKRLSPSHSEWLERQRHVYKVNKNLHTTEEIKMLDQLNQFLNHNWRAKTKVNSFDKRINEITKALVKKNSLSDELDRWLSFQRKKLLPFSSDNSVKLKINRIDKATKNCEYDWKVGKRKSLFNKHYDEILSIGNKPEQFNISQKKWMKYQKNRYYKQNLTRIPQDELTKLKDFKNILQLNWTIKQIKNSEIKKTKKSEVNLVNS